MIHSDLISTPRNWLKREENHILCLETFSSAQNNTPWFSTHFTGFQARKLIFPNFSDLSYKTAAATTSDELSSLKFCQNVPKE